jgi:hypothetical protein
MNEDAYYQVYCLDEKKKATHSNYVSTNTDLRSPLYGRLSCFFFPPHATLLISVFALFTRWCICRLAMRIIDF